MLYFKLKHGILVLGIAMSTSVLSAQAHPGVQQKSFPSEINSDMLGDSDDFGLTKQQNCVLRCQAEYWVCMAGANSPSDEGQCSIDFTICVNTRC